MKKKKQIVNFIIFFSIIIIGISIAIFRSLSLQRNHSMSIGTILKLEVLRGNPEVFVNYSFKSNSFIKKGKTAINNTNSIRDYKFLDSLLKNQLLPVVYQKDNLSNNKMLFSKKECEKYKVELSPQDDRIINTIDSLVKSER